MAARTDARSEVHTQRITVNIRPDWALALDGIAREEGRTLSDVVREALRVYLRKHKAAL